MTDFRYDATVAETWDDLAAVKGLTERERETIARLGDDAECAAPFAAVHVPGWLLDEKDIGAVEGSETIVYTRIRQASEKAVEVQYAGDNEWLPKSQITIVHAAGGIETPTKTLDAWGDA